MSTNTLSPSWAGQNAEPIDPDTIRFKAIKAPTANRCDGCLFSNQTARVCIKACAIAVEAGQPDCDDDLFGKLGHSTVIYVIDDSDPRQLPLLEQEH